MERNYEVISNYSETMPCVHSGSSPGSYNGKVLFDLWKPSSGGLFPCVSKLGTLISCSPSQKLNHRWSTESSLLMHTFVSADV